MKIFIHTVTRDGSLVSLQERIQEWMQKVIGWALNLESKGLKKVKSTAWELDMDRPRGSCTKETIGSHFLCKDKWIFTKCD